MGSRTIVLLLLLACFSVDADTARTDVLLTAKPLLGLNSPLLSDQNLGLVKAKATVASVASDRSRSNRVTQAFQNMSKTKTRRSVTTTETAQLSETVDTSQANAKSTDVHLRVQPGGGSSASLRRRPSMYWAVLHCWLYFLSLGFNAVNIQFLVRRVVDGENADVRQPSAAAIALSGHVEAVDKGLTFLGVAFLSALSDALGRRPLMAWAAIGFGATNLIQAKTRSSVAGLYLADIVDGCSSCMLPVCQAYVADCSPPDMLAGNLGTFQGLVISAAFILAFPIGGVLGAKMGPRVPLYIAAGIQFFNALLITFVTPESNIKVLTTPRAQRQQEFNWKASNPVGGFMRLFGNAHILRVAACAYFFAMLSRASLDAQFFNYANIRFGWSQAQSGPIMLFVGLMLAVVPRLVVPKLGVRKSILAGLLVNSAGLVGTGLAPTAASFLGGIAVVAFGSVYSPALQALLANLAPPGDRGALLGAVGSLVELTGAIGSTMYASILGKATAAKSATSSTTTASTASLLRLLPRRLPPGMHFVVGGGISFLAWTVAVRGFKDNKALNDNHINFAELDQ